jgi:hypothetical protein
MLLYLVKATDICCYNFKYRYTSGIRCVKEISIDGQGLTAVEIFNKNAVGTTQAKFACRFRCA